MSSYLTLPQFVIVADGLHDSMSPKGIWGKPGQQTREKGRETGLSKKEKKKGRIKENKS